MEVSGQIHGPVALPQGKKFSTQCAVGLGGPQSRNRYFVEEKSLLLLKGSNPGSPSSQLGQFSWCRRQDPNHKPQAEIRAQPSTYIFEATINNCDSFKRQNCQLTKHIRTARNPTNSLQQM